MANDLPSWTRPHFQPGGGDAFLYLGVFGNFSDEASVDGPKYRFGGLPDGLGVWRHTRQQHPAEMAGYTQGYVWQELCRRDADLAAAVRHANDCLILRGTVTDPPTLDYLRDAVGLLTHFLDHGGVAIYDPFIFHFWRPSAWRERIFDPAAPVPRHHAVILFSEEENEPQLSWFHTRGLRKFGRPDLSVHNVSPARRDAVIDLFERFIEFQGLGGVIGEGQEIRMKSLPPGGIARHAGSLDDPDYNNVHVEITWPDAAALAS